MPTQPPIEHLPAWAQILVSILICIATLGVAFKGYFRKSDVPPPGGQAITTTAVLGGMIADMGAVRHLSDVIVVLTGQVTTLSNIITEATHYERNGVEVSREICQRMRELCEQMERNGADARRWDERDEGRR